MDLQSVGGRTDFPFCGACPAYVRDIQQGSSRQKLYHEATVIFTDAVVFIRPPLKERLAKATSAVLGGALLGFSTDATVSMASRGVEAQVEHVNNALQEVIYTKYGAIKLTYSDVIKEFGEWAEMWPNSRVIRVTMKKKGIIDKRISVHIKPESGLTRGWQVTRGMAEAHKEMLRKAFGSRLFVE